MSESAAWSLDVPDERPADNASQPVSILVVDDDEWIRQLFVGALADFGYCVRIAPSAADALEVLRVASVDLVLSDITMPGTDGMALSRLLRQTHPSLPVVLMTGYGDAELAREALRQGAVDFLTKPFNIDSIAIVVERNLERHRLERMRALAQDDKVMFQAVEALAVAIDAKQSYTAQHSRRVASLCEIVGSRLALSASEARYLHMAAHVHDVGKIGIPDYILNKEGRLTEEEWAIVRTHPGKGAEIVSRVDELSYIADVVRHHHERIDGRGYPDGLHGESIPYLSRVIAVADAYECMTSDRIYRARLCSQEAIRRLLDGADGQFDAGIVAVFMDLYRDGLIL